MTEDRWRQVGAGIPYRPEAHEARRIGYATSHDEVIAGLSSIAAPIHVPGGRPAAIAVVYIRLDQDADAVGKELAASAMRIESQLA
jgi:DNA-binding IclR family transcriptional regulator